MVYFASDNVAGFANDQILVIGDKGVSAMSNNVIDEEEEAPVRWKSGARAHLGGYESGY